MPRLLLLVLTMVVLASAPAASVAAPVAPASFQAAEISFIEIGEGLTLRRMVVGPAHPKGVVLFLHGFPETLYAWRDISLALADDYEVHAFDWPGYGLSTRPPADEFSYSPRDYARVLRAYIDRAEIDSSRLTIYATDIGALPALLLALEEPDIARRLIVGDFAPFDRPQYMHETLQRLKSERTSATARDQLNRNRDDILNNAYRRGLPLSLQFDISPELRNDMFQGWGFGPLTSADAFSQYYSNFTRDQNHLEAGMDLFRTPVKVIWGEVDFYISSEMGVEFATRAQAEITVFPGLGHYPHLQNPQVIVEEVRASFDGLGA